MTHLIFGPIFIVVGFIALLLTDNHKLRGMEFQALLKISAVIGMTIGAMLMGYSIGRDEGGIIGREEGEKNVLRGNPSIKMDILYKEVDGEFIPTDTLFINIK